MADSVVVCEHEGDVCIIRLNAPESLNAASTALASELHSALVRESVGARALILTGTGRGFCSGANLRIGIDVNAPGYDAGEALEDFYNPLMRCIRDLSIPIVSAVNGVAAGIGAAIAFASDIVVVADSAYFLQPFRNIALAPDGGTAYMLIRAVGRARALEMMLLGERVSASQALDWGLVNRVVPLDSLIADALGIATSLASGPTKALGIIRRLTWSSCETSYETCLTEERNLQRELGRTADHREGIQAFLAKRKPTFEGS